MTFGVGHPAIRSRACRIGHPAIRRVRPFRLGQPAIQEGAYVTTVHPAFYLFLYLTGLHILWKFIRKCSSPWYIKKSNSTEVVKSKLRKTFLAPVLCFDKFQRCIQNLHGFNNFKPLTISVESYFLVASLVSEYPSEYYYMNRFSWRFSFFIWC